QVGDAQLALLQARNDLQTANATLTRLVGEPYKVTADAADTLTGPAVDSDSVFNFFNGGYRYNGTLRFTVSYPLFNQLQREQNVVQAQVAEQNAEAEAHDAVLLAQQNLVAYIGA